MIFYYMPLYKYLKKAHAEQLLNHGKLRLGTLYEYRDMDTHGAVIGDKDEGTSSRFMEVMYERWTPTTQPEFTKSFFNLGSDATLTISGITLEKPQESPDFYLYCTTEVFDENALAEFGYDCCVLIERPQQFFNAISHTIRYKATFDGVHQCQYVPRRQPHQSGDGIHPAIIKDPTYQSQKEVRALWRPIKKAGITPTVIECRDAAKFCTMHHSR
jgi:hypothetical protein